MDAVGVYDFLGEQVPHRLAALGNVGGKHVIEAAVFANDDDDVLNGRGGVAVIVVLRVILRRRSVGQRSADRKLKKRNRGQGDAQAAQRA